MTSAPPRMAESVASRPRATRSRNGASSSGPTSTTGERLGLQRRQEARLVLLTPQRDPVQHRVGARRPVKVAPCGRPFEVRQMPAFEEPDEVGRRVHQVIVDLEHPSMLLDASHWSGALLHRHVPASRPRPLCVRTAADRPQSSDGLSRHCSPTFVAGSDASRRR